jgi:hypothetical protein
LVAQVTENGEACENWKPKLKKYILSSGWDLFDNRNTWFVNEKYDWICYGIETDGCLRNCFGIEIWPDGDIFISNFDQAG